MPFTVHFLLCTLLPVSAAAEEANSESIRVKQLKSAPTGYGNYQFIIRDTGIGMKLEFQKHIFESFSREETSTVSGIQGTGLGMAITKNIVDMMGGTITVKSEECLQRLECVLNGLFPEKKRLSVRNIPWKSGMSFMPILLTGQCGNANEYHL